MAKGCCKAAICCRVLRLFVFGGRQSGGFHHSAAAKLVFDAVNGPEQLQLFHRLDKQVHLEVARAVAQTALKQGIARAEYVSYVDG